MRINEFTKTERQQPDAGSSSQKDRKLPLSPILILAFLVLVGSSATAQTTQFTYQGQLKDNGSAANGNYDLQFKLFDTAVVGTGAQQGSTVLLTSVPVAGGLFTVQLDFGAAPFGGSSRFLEIGVKPTSGTTFTVLGPRQPVTSTPYSIRSVTSDQLGGVSANQYVLTGDNRLSDARPPTPGSANYIQNSTSQQAASNFNISGNGTASGTLAGNIVKANQFNIGNDRALSLGFDSRNVWIGLDAGKNQQTTGENVFVGLRAGAVNTLGYENSFVGPEAGNQTTTGSGNAFFGMLAGATNTTGSFNSFFGAYAGRWNATGNSNTYVGYSAGPYQFTRGSDVAEFNTLIGAETRTYNDLINVTAIGAKAQVTRSNSLVLGSIDGINGATADTRVGIGTTAPEQRLHISGPDSRLRLQSTLGDAYTEIQYHTNWRIWNTGVGGTFVTSPVVGKYYIYDETAGQFRMAIDTSGRMGIGTTNPDQTLSVNGNASKAGGGSWLAFSDERLKNIKGRFTPGLNSIMQLQPLRYEYKRDNALNLKSEGEFVGFSAQQVRRVIPEAVITGEQGYLLVNNDPIMWTMLNAIKEQQAEIEKQRAQLNQQRSAFVAQQQELNSLKKLVCRSQRRTKACK